MSVSTIRDSLPNVEKLVRRNLTGGVDHLVVFLDAEQPVVQAMLDAHPYVTCVRADDDWWQGDRPRLLNDRQSANAGAVGAALSGLPWAEWLFHVDGDEVVWLDRAALSAVDSSYRAVELTPLEAVGQVAPAGDPVLFKTLLDDEQLVLLTALGIIDAPRNHSYFRGHLRGKPGVRPAIDVQVGIHRARDVSGAELPLWQDDAMMVLHYESPSVDEFVRKWSRLIESGVRIRQRHGRGSTAEAVRALGALGLEPEREREFLVRLYGSTAVDDVDSLAALRLLRRVDPDAVTRVPAQPPAEGLEVMRLRLGALRRIGKRQLCASPRPRELSEIAAAVGSIG